MPCSSFSNTMVLYRDYYILQKTSCCTVMCNKPNVHRCIYQQERYRTEGSCLHFFTDCANIIKKIKKKWGDFRIMSNRKERNRQFQIFLSKKMVLRRQRRNGRIARRKKSAIRHGVVYTPSRVRQQRGKRQTHTLTPPDIFSLFQNSAETVAFFDKTVWTIRNCKVQDSIFFDLSNITEITTDAIMYLIAVIKNMRRLKTFRITCRGNLPLDENANIA